MIPLSIIILSGLIGVVLRGRPATRARIRAYLLGTRAYLRVQQILVVNAVVRFLHNFIIVSSILSGLFVMTLCIRKPIFGVDPHVFTIVICAITVVLNFVSMYVFRIAGMVIDEAKDELLPLIGWMRKIQLTVNSPHWSLFLPVAVVNAIWLPFSTSIWAVAGILHVLLRLMATAAKKAKWLARAWAFGNLYLMILMSMFIIDTMAGLHIMNGVIVLLLFLVVVFWLSVSMMESWFIPDDGGWLSARVGYVIMTVLLVGIFTAAISPAFAKGVSRWVKRRGDAVVTWVHRSGYRDTKTKFTQFTAKRDITGKDLRELKEDDNGVYFVKVPATTVAPNFVIVKKGHRVAGTSPELEAENSAVKVMAEYYMPEPNDADFMSETGRRPDRQFWAASELFEEVKDEDEDTTPGFTIPLSSIIESQWNEYGPGTDRPESPANFYMREYGYVVYEVSVDPAQITGTQVLLSVRLSSELDRFNEGRHNGDLRYSSDTTLYVNGTEVSTQNVIADDKVGRDYTWTFPASLITSSPTKITLMIKKEADHKNGLTIHSPLRGTFQ